MGVIFKDEFFGRFAEDIKEKTFLQIILKGHLYIENRLIKLIEINLVNPSALNLNSLSFPVKVSLANALGLLDEERCKLLNNLNKLRNKFAHDLDFELTENEIMKQVNLFNQEYSGMFQKIINENPNNLKPLLRAIYVLTYMELEDKLLQKL